ncbi:aminotransferase class V-fold PLP-dependent enzyme [Streptomyces sp. NPDC047028]|uniref:aminotransferase class V-fold PLP-dependent enzyme n=1 Tax=Streptomyces sp. NPDC047028 TaxID=3155793 RepID=UPI0033E4B54C
MTTTTACSPARPGQSVRADLPILFRPLLQGRRLVYLDSAATTHKPHCVLDAERTFYSCHNAAAHPNCRCRHTRL